MNHNQQPLPFLQILLEDFRDKITGLKNIVPRQIKFPKIKNKIHAIYLRI